MQGTLAEVRAFAGNFAPRNWAFCEGQLLSISANQALFSLLGTMYGGDGRTTFGLPDLRSRIAIGAGQGPGLSDYDIGTKGGTQTVTLTVSHMPTHNHMAYVTNDPGTLPAPGGHILASEAVGATALYSDQNPNTQLSPHAIGNTGGSLSHENRQPYIAMHYIICIAGLFPSRS